MSIKSSLPDWLDRAIAALREGDMAGWMSIYAADAVHEFPFAAEGAVRSLHGRNEIEAYMRPMSERMRFGPLTNIRRREVGDELIIEAVGHHRTIPDDLPRTLAYVWFITRQGDQVTHIRDYMHPLPSAS